MKGSKTWGQVRSKLTEIGIELLDCDCPDSDIVRRISRTGAYRYRCKCGAIFGEKTRLENLVKGRVKSCGCLRAEVMRKIAQPKRVYKSGLPISQTAKASFSARSQASLESVKTAVESAHGFRVIGLLDAIPGGRAQVECICRCDKPFLAHVSDLKRGFVRSCGCLRRNEIADRNKARKIAPEELQVELEKVGSRLSLDTGTEGSKAGCVCRCGRNFLAFPADIKKGASRSCGCLKSGLELELFDFVRSLAPDAVHNTRKAIPPYEIDVYVPGKLGIELHGLYWHREGHGTSTREKLDLMLCGGIPRQLIIFEDEWKDRRHAVEGFIRSILGQKAKVGARKCQIQDGGRDFIDDHHVQGAGARNQEFRCLTLGQKAVASAAFRRRGTSDSTEWELSRYCVGEVSVVGGLSRLVADFWRRHPEATKLVTFADNRISQGHIYQASGFVRTGTVKPRYWYVKGTKRHHRFNFRKDALAQKGWLLPGETEEACMERQGYVRVWDAGKTTWTAYPTSSAIK